ncbi:MAG: ATP-binding protein [Eubacterium sp.]|jgi:AAA+ ATPase superfamily predicted ATPase|nr:ATP-binding protein [Eubacterium sp.]
MFIGRKSELENLNKYYAKNDFQFSIIYGRRRVGKTTLINQFCKDKKTVYFVSVESTLKENLEILSNQILSVLAPEAPRNPFLSFREAVDYIFERAKIEHFIFVIDEYPYLAESDKSVSSILQAAIDKNKDNSRLFLILCGSSMSFMENQVLGYKSPLYGRRSCQFKILPFDYSECADMLDGYTNEEKIILYGIFGGVPEYISRIDNSLTVRENAEELLFNPSGRLFEEPFNLLKQELKMPQTYNGIITAVAAGSSKLNEIATKTGIETSQCSNMLNTLTSLGLVRKEYPVTEENSKKTLYALDDYMFKFWYRFVLPNISRITAGLGKTACSEIFDSQQLNQYTGYTFEHCCKQYVWRNALSFPFSFQKLGRWWGSNKKEKREEEIDFIACSSDSAIFAECKWTNEPLNHSVIEELTRKSELFPQFNYKYYLLFSKSGFDKKIIIQSEKDNNIILVQLDNMFKHT